MRSNANHCPILCFSSTWSVAVGRSCSLFRETSTKLLTNTSAKPTDIYTVYCTSIYIHKTGPKLIDAAYTIYIYRTVYSELSILSECIGLMIKGPLSILALCARSTVRLDEGTYTADRMNIYLCTYTYIYSWETKCRSVNKKRRKCALIALTKLNDRELLVRSKKRECLQSNEIGP